MEVEKGMTYKYLRDKREVPQQVKDELKEFNRVKKLVLDALKEEEQTISQLAQKLDMPKPDVVFYVMSLIKYGFVQTGEIDDMDEYFTYKLKQ